MAFAQDSLIVIHGADDNGDVAEQLALGDGSITQSLLKKSPNSDQNFSLEQSKRDLGAIMCKLAALSSTCPEDLSKRDYSWIAPFRSANTRVLTPEMRKRFLARLQARDANGQPILSQQEKAFLVLSMTIYGSHMNADGTPQAYLACGTTLKPDSDNDKRKACVEEARKVMDASFKELSAKIDAQGNVTADNVGDKAIAALMTDDSAKWGSNRVAAPNMIRALALTSETAADKNGSYNPNYDHSKLSQSLGFEGALTVLGYNASPEDLSLVPVSQPTSAPIAVDMPKNPFKLRIEKAGEAVKSVAKGTAKVATQAVLHPIDTTKKATVAVTKGTVHAVKNAASGITESIKSDFTSPRKKQEQKEKQAAEAAVAADIAKEDAADASHSVETPSTSTTDADHPDTSVSSSTELAPVLAGSVSSEVEFDPKTKMPILRTREEAKRYLRGIVNKLNTAYGPHWADAVKNESPRTRDTATAVQTHDGFLNKLEGKNKDGTPVLTPAERAYLAMVMTGVGETSGRPREDMLAIDRVLLNRARIADIRPDLAPMFLDSSDMKKSIPDRIYGAITKDKQFSPWNRNGYFTVGHRTVKNKKTGAITQVPILAPTTGALKKMYTSVLESLSTPDAKRSGSLAEMPMDAYVKFSTDLVDTSVVDYSQFDLKVGKKIAPIMYFSAPGAHLWGTPAGTRMIAVDGAKPRAASAHRFGYLPGYYIKEGT